MGKEQSSTPSVRRQTWWPLHAHCLADGIAGKVTVGQLIAAAAVSILGALPFCAIGLFIGVRTTSRSAPAFVNIIYQVMMHVSGLFYPLPKFLRAIAPVWPTYHLQQLFFSAIGMSSQGSAITHVAVLVILTLVLTVLAVRRLALKG